MTHSVNGILDGLRVRKEAKSPGEIECEGAIDEGEIEMQEPCKGYLLE